MKEMSQHMYHIYSNPRYIFIFYSPNNMKVMAGNLILDSSTNLGQAARATTTDCPRAGSGISVEAKSEGRVRWWAGEEQRMGG